MIAETRMARNPHSFSRAIKLLDAVQQSVSIQMYVWRNDPIDRIFKDAAHWQPRGSMTSVEHCPWGESNKRIWKRLPTADYLTVDLYTLLVQSNPDLCCFALLWGIFLAELKEFYVFAELQRVYHVRFRGGHEVAVGPWLCHRINKSVEVSNFATRGKK